MRTRILALLLGLCAVPLFAATVIHFEPLPPTDRTALRLHVSSTEGGSCGVKEVQTTVSGTVIRVNAKLATDACDSFKQYRFSTTVGPLAAGVYEVQASVADVPIGSRALIVRVADPVYRVIPDVATSRANERDSSAPVGVPARVVGPGLGSCEVGFPGTCPIVIINRVAHLVFGAVPPDTLLVRLPPYRARPVPFPPGPHDVLVHERNGETIHMPAALFQMDLATPDPAFFEPVLFPIAYSGPGALGSRWQTEIAFRNDNDEPLSTFESWFDVFPPAVNSVNDRRPPARTNGVITTFTEPAGFIAHLPRREAPDVWFGTLIRDLSRQAEALGTEIPVVRERDLFDRPFQLLNVPTDPRFRVALRLYDLETELAPRAITVRFMSMTSDDVIATKEVALQKTIGPRPAYAAIGDLVGAYPELAGKGPLRIEIDPDVIPGQRTMWAMVSVTNNETQHVTVISPQ